MRNMKPAIRICAAAVAFIVFSSSGICSQSLPSDKHQTTTESIGDAVLADDKAAASESPGEHPATVAQPPVEAKAVHVLYVHGINQIGAGDSMRLRKAICKYIGECTITHLGRMYADGPFAADSAPPALALRGERIWNSKEEWNASAPFIDRYVIKGKGHTPILLDEFNWWPIAYPLKCKWLIARDARLTGPSKAHLAICATPTAADPAHPKRYLSYQWISS